jgi:para-nitrobenzyl esterase
MALLSACDSARAPDTRTTSNGALGLVVAPAGRFRAGPARESVFAFLGVPYAQPPVDTLRWREAVSRPPTEQELLTNAFGPTCTQRADSNEAAASMPQSEDCLTLNVWTRGVAADGKKRPVLLWIHGGANVSGGSADPLYDGHAFVRDNAVVMVSINYRLGPFGFLDLSAVGDASFARSRNLGLLDQLAALRWVRTNIAAFGGDSSNITVFGESAGGSAVMRLMAMPLARGLFEKAIIESGGPANIRMRGVPTSSGLKTGVAIATAFRSEAGARDLASLQLLPADSVLAVAERVAQSRGDAMGVITWGARADGDVLPEDVFGEIRRGAGAGIKVLIGTNEDEMLYFRLYDANFEQKLMREYHATSSAMGRSFATVRQIADAYIGGSADPKRFVDFAGELWLRQPSILFAEGTSRFSDTYMYLWTWDSAVPGLGACHAVELPFVFGNLYDPSAARLVGNTPPVALSRRIQAAWTAFATTGDPSIAGEVAWPRYTESSRATMRIDAGTWRVLNDPGKESRLLLRTMFDVGQ